jgi:hypothetical protein
VRGTYVLESAEGTSSHDTDTERKKANDKYSLTGKRRGRNKSGIAKKKKEQARDAHFLEGEEGGTS